ncbi:UDP-2,3-diacylglucosamine diphosphatase [Hippea alviniae]|uniref:UDP-2,3-diacylglucosamine diphosphatase n=1 Tax=Hippea alviniae TaxID=1279027 RepID=UPI0003B72D31|nr:UDP-2,3-diacylglucosamine diphosphatase [Hippea alviniae]
MKCLFLSDAHYPFGSYIVDFLLDTYHRYDAIYILGDLFEFYYGYKGFVYPHHRKLISVLSLIAKKRRLVLFEGNHEYRLKNIREFVDAEVVYEFKEEIIDKFRVFLAHGDTIDANDRAYRLFRAFLKNRITLDFINYCVSKSVLLKLSKIASDFSKNSLRDKSYRRTSIALEKFAKSKIEEGFDVVVLAHTHEPVFKKIKNGLYINTGEFIKHPTYAVYENGQFELKSI